MLSTIARSWGWAASHSGVNRVSSSRSPIAARSAAGECGELVQRVRRTARAARRRAHQGEPLIRSGHVTASSWATIPPKLMPTTAHRSQPTWSSSAAASAA